MKFLIGLLVALVTLLSTGRNYPKMGQCAYPTIPGSAISQKFDAYNPSMIAGNHLHKGIDIKVGVGAPVYADLDGIVIYAGVQQTGYGRHIIIRHPNGNLSIFGHLSVLKVTAGEQVISGQLIGRSGGDPDDDIDGDGSSTGAHLHWEMRPVGFTANWNYAFDPIEYCLSLHPTRYEIAYVTAPVGLNVHISPSQKSPILYSLYSREKVEIVEERDGWARLNSERPEWVRLEWLEKTGIFVPDP